MDTTLGPMANIRFANHVRGQITDALQRGAVAHIKTFQEDDGGVYLTPQILTNVDHSMKIMIEERFWSSRWNNAC